MNRNRIAEEKDLRKKFKDILMKLATSQNLLQDSSERYNLYVELENLYVKHENGECFRHFYSDIFPLLGNISKKDSNGLDVLAQNLEYIREHYEPKSQNSNNITNNLRKLYDHVNLDIARIRFVEQNNEELKGSNFIRDNEAIKGQIKSLSDSIKRQSDELKSQKREYVAILGIFAAVILAFTNGIAFSSSVLNNIAAVSIHKILFVSLTVGVVLADVLFCLFYYMDRLVNVTHEFKIIPMIVTNMIVLILLLLVYADWYHGVIKFLGCFQ